MNASYALWILAAFVISAIYTLICLYLIHRERIPLPTYNTEHMDKLEKQFSTPEALKEYESKLESDPNNFDLRRDILLARVFIFYQYDQESAEQALWFYENAPLHSFTLYHANAAFNPTQDKSLIEKATNLFKKHIDDSKHDMRFVYAAAVCLQMNNREASTQYWNELLAYSPFSSEAISNLAKIEIWKIPKGLLAKHPVPEIKINYDYLKRLMANPWNDRTALKLEQLRWRYKSLFPVWYCVVLLRIWALFHKNSSPWQSYADVSNFGMSAYHYGDYETAKKCSEQFIRLQPAAQAAHNHLPLYAQGFSLAAMLALDDGNLFDVKKYLDKKAEEKVDSEFDFLFHDKEILSALARHRRPDIAIEYIKNRWKSGVDMDEGTLDLIEYLNSGGIPYSVEDYQRLDDKYKSKSQ